MGPIGVGNVNYLDAEKKLSLLLAQNADLHSEQLHAMSQSFPS